MAISGTPPATGPFWIRNSQINDYGGDVDKHDLNNIAPINPLTDVTAAQFKSLSDHLVAAVKTAPLGVYVIDCSTSGNPCPIVSKSSYLPDPDVQRISSNQIRITYPATHTDVYNQEAPILPFAVVISNGSVVHNPFSFSISTNEITLTSSAISDNETIVVVIY